MSNGTTTFAEATDTQAVAVVPTAEQTRAGEPPPVRSLSLYEHEQLLAEIGDADSEDGMTAEQRTMLAEITHLAAQEKRDAVARFILTVKAQIDAIKAEEGRLHERRRTAERKLERLTEYVRSLVDTYAPAPRIADGPRKLEGKAFSLCTQRNPVSVEITDEAAVPSQYQTATIVVPAGESADIAAQFTVKSIKFETSKTAIKQAIEAGTEVPGAELRQTRRLVVR